MEENEKYIDIKEFVDFGYLQEVNRLFFHPLGLALEVETDGEYYEITGLWDSREDPEGIYFDYQKSDNQRIEKALKKASNIFSERMKRNNKRNELLGFVVEPIQSKEK